MYRETGARNTHRHAKEKLLLAPSMTQDSCDHMVMEKVQNENGVHFSHGKIPGFGVKYFYLKWTNIQCCCFNGGNSYHPN